MTATRPAPPALELRPIDEAEWVPFVQAAELAFHSEPREVEYEIFRIAFPLERSVAAFDGDRIVGTAGAFELELTVPGRRSVRAAGVTAVGVVPTHRRRGILTSIMQRQLEDYHRDGLAVAALWASEAVIYPRFGYGLASWSLQVEVPREGNAFMPSASPPVGALHLADPATAESRTLLAGLDTATRLNRPGRFARDAEWMRRTVADPEHWREGAGPLQMVVHEGAGGFDGYALYSVSPKYENGLPAGQVTVREIDAADALGYATLWRYLLDMDLIQRVVARARPVDDPLLGMLADPRRARPAMRDNLFVRLVDVPAALAARCYSRPLDVVLDVSDRLCPWNEGRWRLRGDESGASCEPTTEPADLVLSSTELAAVYLGGPTLRSLAAARAVVETRPGTLAATSAAFHSDIAPCCPEVF